MPPIHTIQLTRAQLPAAALPICLILENPRHLLFFPEALQPKQMPVHALPVRCPHRVLDVPCHRALEQGPEVRRVPPCGRGRVEHRADLCRCLITRASDHLCPAVLKLASLCALVSDAGPAVHLLESELLNELRLCVRGKLVFLHEGLPIAFVVQDLREMK